MRKVKIPWFTIVRLLGSELPEIIEDLKEAKTANSPGGRQITKEEFREIFYEHMVMHVVPAIFDAFCSANGWSSN